MEGKKMVYTVRKIAAAMTAAGGAVGLLVAGPASPAAAQPAPCVKNIAVLNNAAFTMSFLVSPRAGVPSAPTDPSPVDQSRVVALSSTPIAAGEDVRPVVSATAGDTVASPTFVSYCT